ncbi:hypothetical protein NPIL_527131, partial [Nephila pilipes]
MEHRGEGRELRG